MDSGNIVYLIAVIIYFIYTALKRGKSDQLPDQEAGRDQENPQEQQRPVSFDDLLREIRSGQQDREKDLKQSGQGDKVQPPGPTKPDIFNRPDPRSYEQEVPAPEMEDATFGKYEGFVSEKERPKLKTLDEQVSIPSALTGLGVSEEGVTYSKIKASPTNRYADLLKNPETVKDAIILSEILNRKEY